MMQLYKFEAELAEMGYPEFESENGLMERILWPHPARRVFEADPYMGEASRTMRLTQAVKVVPHRMKGLYVLLWCGRPFYAGKSIDLRKRILNYLYHIHILKCGKVDHYSVRLAYMPWASAAKLSQREGALIRRVNRLNKKGKQARLTNKQLARLRK
jgi:hypothetical protein